VKIRIEGREYPVVGHRSANLLHLIELREHTRALFAEPLGMARLDDLERVSKRIRAGVVAVKAAREDAVERGDDLAVAAADDDLRRLEAEQADDGLLGMAIVIFLSRRKAGDRVTFAQAVDVDIAHDVDWIPEPDDEQPVAPDPGDGVPLDGVTAAPDPHSPAPDSPGTRAGDPDPAPVPPKVKRASKGGRSTTSRSR
jgi:hypothetical protein